MPRSDRYERQGARLAHYDYNGRPVRALRMCGAGAVVQYDEGKRAFVPSIDLRFADLHSLYLRRNRLRDDPELGAWAERILMESHQWRATVAEIISIIRAYCAVNDWKPADLARAMEISYTSAYRLLKGDNWRGEPVLAKVLVGIGVLPALHDPAARARTEDIMRAHAAVARAIKTGDLVKEPCQVCGSPESEAHHPDYSSPLDVMWLCSLHHNRLHREIDQSVPDDTNDLPPELDGWTPVDYAVPAKRGWYLTTIETGHPKTWDSELFAVLWFDDFEGPSWFTDQSLDYASADTVTHWRPLPPPPARAE